MYSNGVSSTLFSGFYVIPYDELDNHFTAPKIISPFFNHKRIPRKIKKRYAYIFKGDIYSFLTLNQKLWYNLTLINPNYTRFIIKQIVSNDNEYTKRNNN